MIEIPELAVIVTFGGERGYVVYGKDKPLTKAQALEVIHRCEQYEKMRESREKMKILLKELTDNIGSVYLYGDLRYRIKQVLGEKP